MDEFRAAFHVERPQSAVWERLRTARSADGRRCRIPGFPGADGQPGCLAALIASEPQKSLRVYKEDAPCAGSVIDIAIGPANASGWPTHVAVAQSGLPPELAALGDAPRMHWRRIVADLRLYLEHGVHAPVTDWGANFGASLVRTPVGLAVASVDADGFAARCGMRQGDVLLALRGVRVYGFAELWTLLALAAPGDAATARWVRDGCMLSATAIA